MLAEIVFTIAGAWAPHSTWTHLISSWAGITSQGITANRAVLPPVLQQTSSELPPSTECGHTFGKPAQNLSMSFNKVVFLLLRGVKYGLQKFQTLLRGVGFDRQKNFLPLLYKDRMLHSPVKFLPWLRLLGSVRQGNQLTENCMETTSWHQTHISMASKFGSFVKSWQSWSCTLCHITILNSWDT